MKLTERRDEIQKGIDALQSQAQQYQNMLQGISAELLMAQGALREVDRMLRDNSQEG